MTTTTAKGLALGVVDVALEGAVLVALVVVALDLAVGGATEAVEGDGLAEDVVVDGLAEVATTVAVPVSFEA